ncbi:MAG: ABC transporter ATP-binding protein/permease [Aphanocapsa sp. GSE-SYN-MK-11-07L]|jgi:putative ATP-binding cassette transporter|nr:ABC transporter ATP-binding protein/permease [Aphanocapsa sp. GSE-SYN-MK-11-07L]
MSKANRQLWNKFLAIAQPYFYPTDQKRSGAAFLWLLLLLVVFLFAALFVIVSAVSLSLQALFPQTFGSVAGGLVKLISGIINSPGSIVIGLMLLIPTAMAVVFRRNLIPRWQPWALLGLLLLLSLSVSGLNVIISFVGRFFQTALAEKDQPTFWRFLFVYAGVFVVGTPIVVIYRYVRDKLGLKWREWLTNNFLERYFRNRAYYDINSSDKIDNPDQRIAEDIRSFTVTSLGFLLIILGNVIDLISFTGILILISLPLTIALIIYATFGTVITILIGRRLIRLNFNQLRREADFRYGLVHVRDNSEAIAFYRGEEQESSQVRRRLTEVLQNFNFLIGWRRNLSFFTTSYGYFIIILPSIVVAPIYFAGKIDFGAISQAGFAFSQVLGALSIIVDQFDELSAFIAGIDRLAGFADVLDPEDKTANGTAGIDTVEDGRLALEHVTVLTPNGERTLVKDLSVALESGGGLVIVGHSGVGKSSVLRAIAGLWNAGTGKITRPQPDQMLFLPQRPYMILGTLRDQLLYPHTDSHTSESELQKALKLVNLESLPERVGGFDVELDWADVLSLGEQQRLAVARLLLTRPPFAILDEATSALDLKNEQLVYEQIQSTASAFISVGHRPSLLKYHQQVLELKDDGSWELSSSQDYVPKAEVFS